MTRHPGLLLFLVLSPLWAVAQDTGDKKPEKTADAEKTGAKAEAATSPKIQSISVVGDLMSVNVTDKSGKVTPLGFEADKDGNKLVSVSIEAETKRARVVVVLAGESHTITQPLRPFLSLDKPSLTPRPARGQSVDDRKRFEGLSEAAKEKFRDGMRRMFSEEKFRNAPEEERRTAIRALFDEVQKEDQASKSKP